MTQLIPDARCPVCGLALLITFRTISPKDKTFEYHHDRIPSEPCVVVIPQPDVDYYEELVYKPLIVRSPTSPVQ